VNEFFRESVRGFEPPEVSISRAAGNDLKFFHIKIPTSRRNFKPFEDPRQFFLKVVVASALVEGHHGVDVLGVEHVVPGLSIEEHRILAIEFAVDEIGRNVAGILPILNDVLLCDSTDDDSPCPKVGVCQG